MKNAINNFNNIKKQNFKKYLVLGDMLELGKIYFSIKIYQKLLTIQILIKFLLKAMKRLIPMSLNVNKRGNIFQQDEDVDFTLNNIISNNDYLMIKGSNATGLNNFTKKIIKGLMLFHFFTSLIDQYSFNVFKYLTFRTGLSVISSLVIFNWSTFNQIFLDKMITGPIRQDGPIDHIVKKTGTPTMGGVIIIIGIISSTALGRFKKYLCMDIIFVSLSLEA